MYYFAHSYHVTEQESGIAIGVSNYGVQFPAVINYHNFYGVQFHPESVLTENGKLMISNWLSE